MRNLLRARRVRVAKVVLALVVSVVLIVFVLSNAQPVAVDFVFVTSRPRLIWVMLACAVLGGIVGYVIGRPGRRDAPRDERRASAPRQPEP